MTPVCVLVCSRRHLLADRHLTALPFDPFPPIGVSAQSASHHPVSFLPPWPIFPSLFPFPFPW